MKLWLRTQSSDQIGKEVALHGCRVCWQLPIGDMAPTPAQNLRPPNCPGCRRHGWMDDASWMESHVARMRELSKATDCPYRCAGSMQDMPRACEEPSWRSRIPDRYEASILESIHPPVDLLVASTSNYLHTSVLPYVPTYNGYQQALGLYVLHHYPPEAKYTSTYTRCLQSIHPLPVHTYLPIEPGC